MSIERKPENTTFESGDYLTSPEVLLSSENVNVRTPRTIRATIEEDDFSEFENMELSTMQLPDEVRQIIYRAVAFLGIGILAIIGTIVTFIIRVGVGF